MLAIHITQTPLAGAPIRIVQALNSHTDISARLINLNPDSYGRRTFPEDLIWEKDKDECIKLIKQADILHFHHYFDIETSNNPFSFNFKDNMAKNCKVIRHFHSGLDFIAKSEKQKEKIINDKYQKVVIPHCPERYYPQTPIIPNIIPIHSDMFTPPNETNLDRKFKVFYSASMLNSQWTARWNTKGYPEISKKLRKLSHKLGFEYIEAIGIDFETCQNLKRQSDIVIGDIVTGSYHLTELEALAQGKVVLSFLDNQTQMTLQNLTGCTDIPIVNTYIDELEPILEYLIKHKDVCSQLGTLSRKWIEQYYDDKKLIQILVDLYKKLLNGEKIERENSKEYQEAKDFLHRKVYDIKWQVRKEKSFKLRHQLLYNVLRLGFKAISAVCPKSKKEFFKEKSRRYRITNY